ncbi:MAG TPA: hypothetical protein VEO73_08990 [Gemmatimonadales bacterium]|nr:hypothetical protein [Gemmatimonadales bacterium]
MPPRRPPPRPPRQAYRQSLKPASSRATRKLTARRQPAQPPPALPLPFPPRQLQLVAQGCVDCGTRLTVEDHRARGPDGLCKHCKLTARAASARTPPRLKHRPELGPRR